MVDGCVEGRKCVAVWETYQTLLSRKREKITEKDDELGCKYNTSVAFKNIN